MKEQIKPELNSENRQKFYSLYYLQDVFYQPLIGQHITYCFNGANIDELEDNDGCYLLLRDISSITDKELKELAKNHDIEIGNSFLEDYSSLEEFRDGLIAHHDHCHTLRFFDDLRSQGFALRWMNLSVEDLVNAGWVKLKGVNTNGN